MFILQLIKRALPVAI